MSFLREMFPSFEDKVAKVNSPQELIQLWKEKEKEKKPEDLAIVEKRLAGVLADISDLPVIEGLFALIDKRIGDWIRRVKETILSDDDHHIMTLGEKGVHLKHLIALVESPNLFRAALAENMINEMGSVRPDLVKEDGWRKAIYQTTAKNIPLFNFLESRLLDILVEEISRIDDVDVLSGLFDLATIGEGSSEIRNLKSRELIVDRICVVINQIDDIDRVKELNVPQFPQIVETIMTRLES